MKILFLYNFYLHLYALSRESLAVNIKIANVPDELLLAKISAYRVYAFLPHLCEFK